MNKKCPGCNKRYGFRGAGVCTSCSKCYSCCKCQMGKSVYVDADTFMKLRAAKDRFRPHDSGRQEDIRERGDGGRGVAGTAAVGDVVGGVERG